MTIKVRCSDSINDLGWETSALNSSFIFSAGTLIHSAKLERTALPDYPFEIAYIKCMGRHISQKTHVSGRRLSLI